VSKQKHPFLHTRTNINVYTFLPTENINNYLQPSLMFPHINVYFSPTKIISLAYTILSTEKVTICEYNNPPRQVNFLIWGTISILNMQSISPLLMLCSVDEDGSVFDIARKWGMSKVLEPRDTEDFV